MCVYMHVCVCEHVCLLVCAQERVHMWGGSEDNWVFCCFVLFYFVLFFKAGSLTGLELTK